MGMMTTDIVATERQSIDTKHEESAAGANEVVCEIRFKPNPRVLDHRGEWVDALSQALGLPRWSISNNRFELHDEPETKRAFFGHRNAGFVVLDSQTANYFPDQAAKFVRSFFALPDFGTHMAVERIGVRTRLCVPTEMEFDRLCRLFNDRFGGLSRCAEEVLALSSIQDVGVSLVLCDESGTFNLSGGPMRKVEFEAHFAKRQPTAFPTVGLFVDVDFFVASAQTVDEKGLVRELKRVAEASWSRATQVRRIVLGI